MKLSYEDSEIKLNTYLNAKSYPYIRKWFQSQ